MTRSPDEDLQEWRNDADVGAPLISVAVPFKDYDVGQLARELVEQAAGLPCEILFADDGSDNTAHASGLRTLFAASTTPCRLLGSPRNLGRAAIRNRLAAQASGTCLLYLDADVLPDSTQFLGRYVELARQGGFAAIYGGRSYRRVGAVPPSQRLYLEYSQRAECMPAATRNEHPQWYLMTNNLLVPRELLQQQPFSEAYVGWGYEDTEWALRLRADSILHVDNTASHLGLVDTDELVRKIESSRANFLRIADDAPGFREIPMFRRALMLSRFRRLALALRSAARPLLHYSAAPLPLRFAALQGFRVATYADALGAAVRQ